MTNLHPVPHDQASDAMYWLDLAKRILGGDIKPDEARHILKLGALYLEAAADGDRPVLPAAGQ